MRGKGTGRNRQFPARTQAEADRRGAARDAAEKRQREMDERARQLHDDIRSGKIPEGEDR